MPHLLIFALMFCLVKVKFVYGVALARISILCLYLPSQKLQTKNYTWKSDIERDSISTSFIGHRPSSIQDTTTIMESYILPLLAVAIGICLLLFRLTMKSWEAKSTTATSSSTSSKSKTSKIDNKVPLDPAGEALYIANCLRPDSTSLDILYACATSPDMLAITRKQIELREELIEQKLAAKQEKEKADTMEDLLADDGGWAQEDDDAATVAAKKAAEQKAKEARQLAAATGKEDLTKLKLEGFDEGVLGAEWVVARCEEIGRWPPPGFKGDLSDPAVRRNMLMTMGRIHAMQLNAHPELLKAGPSGMIDKTYFNGTLEFRGRVGQLLDAALKMACTLKCYRLALSILDAIVMFKTGLDSADDPGYVAHFKNLMAEQYGPSGIPRLIFTEKYLGVPITEHPGHAPTETNDKEAEKNKITQLVEQTKAVTSTDETMSLVLNVTRQHAESFTKQKLAECVKQGVPPQVVLNSYKEGWFVMVRASKVGGSLSKTDHIYGTDHLEVMKAGGNKLYEMLNEETVAAFKAEFEEDQDDKRLVLAWPFEIKNVAQKAGRVAVKLHPPREEGKYLFHIMFKSTEFLGADEEFTLELDVKKGIEKIEEEEVVSEVADKKND